MKSWQRVAIGMLSPLVTLWWAGTAFADDSQNIPSLLDEIVVPIMVIIEGILGYWVAGNTLTDPVGENLVASLSQIVQELADFLAQFSLML